MMSHDFESNFSLYTQQNSPHNRLIKKLLRENLAKKATFIRKSILFGISSRYKKIPLEHYPILASCIHVIEKQRHDLLIATFDTATALHVIQHRIGEPVACASVWYSHMFVIDKFFCHV